MSEEKLLPWGLKPKSLAPGSLKGLSDNKLKAFNIGTMNVVKASSRRELEEMRKKKDEEETEEVFKEFVQTFQDNGKGIERAWVKGGVTSDNDLRNNKTTTPSNKLYKPTSKFSDKKAVVEVATLKKEEKMEKPPSLKKKGLLSAERKKTNLELFKEELKVIQEERSERRKFRKDLGFPNPNELGMPQRTKPHLLTLDNEPIAAGVSMGIMSIDDDVGAGMFNYDNDTQTTNIYLGNLNPKMTEMQICEIFGHYGPLASVKVMWPRTDEEKSRGRNCGFVAFMNRKDAERGMNNLQNKELMSFEMKLGWGKCVVIPAHPIYIPPALSELTLPPPPSGLPFNAQAVNDSKDLDRCVVKVVIPTEKNLMCVIHRMIEFVVREGPMFEAMIMNRELHNPLFRFLFENKTPAHIYYRWKLYTILQGDSPYSWRADEYRMFSRGSLWRPPPKNPFSQGMPEELIREGGKEGSKDGGKGGGVKDGKRVMLSESQRERFEDMLRGLTAERSSIGDCMVWCLKHADYAEEITECICQAVCQPNLSAQTRVARLFLISDLLHNSSARLPNASYYRRFFEGRLEELFKSMRQAHSSITARLKAEQFKQKVMACFRVWEEWTVYHNDLLINLQNIFLGLVQLPMDGDEQEEEDVDGIPLEELDGIPMDPPTKNSNNTNEDDGGGGGGGKSIVPYSNDSDGEATADSLKPSFVPSKWEVVDENELESQAMTVSKWDTLKGKGEGVVDYEEDEEEEEEEDIDGIPLEDSKSNNTNNNSSNNTNKYERSRLKEIEIKVLRYQDELEGGKGGLDGRVVAERVHEYRQQLLQKEFPTEQKVSSRKAEKKKRDGDGRKRRRDEEEESSRDKDSATGGYASANDEDDSPPSSQDGRSRNNKKRSHTRSPLRRKSPKHKSSKKTRR